MRRILLFVLSLCLAACNIVEPVLKGGDADCPPADGISVRIKVGGTKKSYDTRSVLTGDDIETRVTDVTLAAYDGNGILSSVKYYDSDFSSMTLDLAAGMPYEVYALANMGDMTGKFPAEESEASSMEYLIPSYDDVNVRGIPMCGAAEVNPGDPDVSVILERLFAKVTVRILHSGMENYDEGALWTYNLCNKSIYLRQANNRLMPFSASGSRAEDKTDVMETSDCHADLDNRNEYQGHLHPSQIGPGPGYYQDTTLVFYVPENMQGRLLPQNEDPFGKEHGSIQNIDGKSYSDICTYLEFNAYRSGTLGYSGSLMYRYYLGADSTSDFSLERNCRYDVTLDFSEDGFFMDSWKITRGDDWNDTRSLFFHEDVYLIHPGKSKNLMVHYHPFYDYGNSMLNSDRWTYSIDIEAMRAAGLTVDFDPDNLVPYNGNNDFCFRVEASDDARIGSSFPLTVMTRDGAVADHAVISVVEETELKVNWNSCPQYVSQYGSFTVTGHEPSDLPLQFTISHDSVASCTKEGDDVFNVVLKGAGGAYVTVSSADGSKSVSAYVSSWNPKLVLDRDRVDLNMDGTIVRLGYEYQTSSGAPLTMIDKTVFNSVLRPAVSGSGFFDVSGKDGSMELYIGRFTYGGERIIARGTYYIDIVAGGGADVAPADLVVSVIDPFEGLDTYDYGRLDDYSLFSISDSSYGLREEFADEINACRLMTYPGPVPNADPSCLSIGLVPRWEGKFCNGSEAYSISRNVSTGQITLRQNTITASTKHSVGLHDVVMTVRNRHSGETSSWQCGMLEIYVHTAIGAKAVFGKRECWYVAHQGGKTFADVYNALAGRQLYPHSSSYIYYMDVSMEWMTPVEGVYVFDKAGEHNHSFDGLDFILPLETDGVIDGNHLFSVCENRDGDRLTVAEEPGTARAGVGRLLYRALLTQAYGQILPEATLERYFMGVQPGTMGALYAPAYLIPAEDRFKDGVLDFIPSAVSPYVAKSGSGYHMIHFLDSIYPETSGWINLID